MSQSAKMMGNCFNDANMDGGSCIKSTSKRNSSVFQGKQSHSLRYDNRNQAISVDRTILQ